MNRRDLLKLAAGGAALAGAWGCSTVGAARSEGPATRAAPSGPGAASAPRPLPLPKTGPLPVALVVGKDADVLDFCGPLEVFAGAVTAEGTPLFAPYLVAASLGPVAVGGGMRVLPDHTFESAPQPKVIVIPAMDLEAATPAMIGWIRTASAATDVTMSVCNGAFVLARTGLLSGRSATAHHAGFFRFAGEFPDVHLRRGARFVEDGNLASAGGISSGIDLALRVVERYVGRELAASVADGMEYQGQGWLDPDSNGAYARLPAFTEEHPLCPVCLMDGDRAITSTFRGKRYSFCAPSEKAFFDQHTEVFERFLEEDQRAGGR
ncbi:MAG: DJ-1/PfpI family protein [Anaeromyxobacter sp.]|nr:DJ-1/PfpI family protein [Anaeromyxobacter sp.]MBL0274873.1 DJ-1/PfpI family protein [Anaeromyxobacter sp.]